MQKAEDKFVLRLDLFSQLSYIFVSELFILIQQAHNPIIVFSYSKYLFKYCLSFIVIIFG